MSEYAIALDVGGTFTDVTLAELTSGRLWRLKTPTTPDEPRCAEIGAWFRARGVESVAVCLLYSYANAAHERRTGELIQAAYPDAHLSLSADVLPVFREYERSMATVLNAYVMPLVSGYIGRLRARLAEEGVGARLYV